LPDGGNGVRSAGPIRSVVVAGGGIVAWSVAAALRKHIPLLEVAVASCPVPADALADRMIATLPSIAGFHDDLGLSEEDTVVRARSGLRAGTLFEGWTAGLPDYVHAYGSCGAPLEGAAFHQFWLRTRASEQIEPFDRYSAAAELGRMGRIGSGAAATPPAPEIGYGLHLTLERYHALMRAYALHLGATERPCSSFAVKLRSDDGFVDSLMLDGEVTLAADLYVDCTGPAALVRGRLDGGFADWSRWLPCDRLTFAEGEPDADGQLLDRVTATAAGWRWHASSPARSSDGIAFSWAHSSGEEELGDNISPATAISIRQGRWAEPWLRNCVAIGDSAVAIEPLEWANLHLAHSQIDRLISMMPGRDCAPVELSEYNRQCGAEAERVRDFLCMHYVTARREEPFWKDAAAIEPPDSLAHTLALFAERGRLPFYEEETFTRDSWLAVLLGQGFEPRRTDPLADSIAFDEVRQQLARCSQSVRSFAAVQPNYSDYMATILQRTSR
jgi:tryptophan 7-halogenase